MPAVSSSVREALAINSTFTISCRPSLAAKCSAVAPSKSLQHSLQPWKRRFVGGKGRNERIRRRKTSKNINETLVFCRFSMVFEGFAGDFLEHLQGLTCRGAAEDQVPHDVEVARDDRQVESRVLVLSASIQVLGVVDELHHEVQPAVQAGQVQRRELLLRKLKLETYTYRSYTCICRLYR